MKLRILTQNGRELQTAHEVRIPGWTEGRFLREAPDEGFFEFKDGELIMRSPVSVGHQRMVGFLGTLLRLFVGKGGLGEVFAGPAVLRLRENLDREPDLFFVRSDCAGQIREQYVESPVDLVVEVTSPGSESRDAEEKRDEYEQAGIREYWVVDREARVFAVHVLREGKYELSRMTSGRLHAHAVPGFSLQVEWLWQDPLPSEIDCLRAMAAGF